MQEEQVMPVLPHEGGLIGFQRRSDAIDSVSGGHIID